MVQKLQKQLREAAVRAELVEIAEVLNKEHGPALREVKARLQELIDGLNPGEVVLAAGVSAGFLNVTIAGNEYSIELFERA